MWKKLKSLHHICLKTALTNIFIVWFTMFKLVAIAACKRMDAGTFKKHATAQPNPF